MYLEKGRERGRFFHFILGQRRGRKGSDNGQVESERGLGIEGIEFGYQARVFLGGKGGGVCRLRNVT